MTSDTSIATNEPIQPTWREVGKEWLPVLAGIPLLYAAPIYGLATTLWREDDYAHAPIILLILFWLVWDKRSAILEAPKKTHTLIGLPFFLIGLVLYVLGQSQGITVLAIGSIIPVLGGVILAMRGATGLRALWFVLLFAIYLVPLPTAFVGDVTGQLKQYVSQSAEQLLYMGGYPIARSGVMLTVGRYQLLVADACSGINSMISLSAVGLLYLYIMRRTKWLHIALVIASLLPIAFLANVVRVTFLVLLTYYFGDAAGQGFLHGFSGMALFIVALILILGFDAILARVIKPVTTAG